MANTPTRRNASACSVCGNHGHNCRTCPSGLFNDVLNSAIIKADKCIESIPEIGAHTSYQNLYEWLVEADNSFSVGGLGNCYITNAMSILATRLRITTSITTPNRIRVLCGYLFTTRTIEKNASGVIREYTPRERGFRNGLTYQTDIAVARLRETAREEENTRRMQEYARLRARALEQERIIRERQREERVRARALEQQIRSRSERQRQENARVRSQVALVEPEQLIIGVREHDVLLLHTYFTITCTTPALQQVFIENIRSSLLTHPTSIHSGARAEWLNRIDNGMINILTQQIQPPRIVPVMTTVSQGVITESECPICYENKTTKELIVYDCKHCLCVSCYDGYLSHLHGRRATCAICRAALTKVYREETV